MARQTRTPGLASGHPGEGTGLRNNVQDRYKTQVREVKELHEASPRPDLGASATVGRSCIPHLGPSALIPLRV